MMRLILKEGPQVLEAVRKLLATDDLGKPWGISTDPLSGLRYIETLRGIGDPIANKIRPELLALMERITGHDCIYDPAIMKPEGKYILQGVEIMLRTIWERGAPSRQILSFSGPPNLELLEEVLTLFRQGKLKPPNSWQPPAPAKPGWSVALLRWLGLNLK